MRPFVGQWVLTSQTVQLCLKEPLSDIEVLHQQRGPAVLGQTLTRPGTTIPCASTTLCLNRVFAAPAPGAFLFKAEDTLVTDSADSQYWPAEYRTDCVRLISGHCWSQSSPISLPDMIIHILNRHPQKRSVTDTLQKGARFNLVRFYSISAPKLASLASQITMCITAVSTEDALTIAWLIVTQSWSCLWWKPANLLAYYKEPWNEQNKPWFG